MTKPRPPALDAPDLLDFLDCLPDGQHFRPGSIMLLLADEQAEVLLSVAIDDIGDHPPQHERVDTLNRFLCLLAAQEPRPAGIGLLVCRRGYPDVQGDDLGWHDAAVAACAHAGFTWHGAFVVTTRGAARMLPHAA